MAFNSLKFLFFFIIVILVYYILLKDKTKAQNLFLLIVSYLFYGMADWKMIPFLFGITVVFYFLGIGIYKSTKIKATLLKFIGVSLGVGFLLYFKYFNFFIESFLDLFKWIGLKFNWGTFNIILPLGISFFTFRLISYVIEIYRGKIEPTKDFVNFATYIAFFPTILSGPIDRPNNFLPQLKNKRPLNYDMLISGGRQFLWGLFKKMVIADNLAGFVNSVWSDIPHQSGYVLFISAIAYSFQMYTDFSGYSDMAIGIGKILGFQITKNFDFPFLSRNVAEFWRKWHISLTSWLTDYVFMPLNVKFRNMGNFGLILAILINMLIVGLWHGANWTFALFGLYHGLLFIPLILNGSFFKNKKMKMNKFGFPKLLDVIKIIGTFLLVTFGLVIFRAESISQVFEYISGFAHF
jgi:alginate O-acetyltransferase complex protein AlgI